MHIHVTIPIQSEILSKGCPIIVAKENMRWSKIQLGEYADRSGVYIHHSSGKILYIGKTTEGKYGIFGERLRREFQTKAASSSPLHKLLAAQTKDILTYFLDLKDIDMMINSGSLLISPKRKALIMEQALIGIYLPSGNIK